MAREMEAAKVLRPNWRGPAVIVAGAIGLTGVGWASSLVAPYQELGGRPVIVDGDSFSFAGQRVRLLGIDAPELGERCPSASGASWPCGPAARDRLRALAAPHGLVCRTSGRDAYKRLLARCRAGGADVAAMLVQEGLAANIGPYAAQEGEARDARLGIWAGGGEVDAGEGPS